MTVDVVRPDGSGYAVKDRWMVPGGEPVSVGSELCVVVDRAKQDRIAIDWVATRELAAAKNRERRQLISPGVPVPVSKLREEAEARGLVQALREPTPAEEAVGVGKPLTPPAPPAPPAPEPEQPKPVMEGPVQKDDHLLERLERLASLHSAGELTDEEFSAVKRQLIA